MNNNFLIQQFEDKSLSHYAYAILSEGKIMLIDPARNPQPYYDFAKQHHAKIVGVIETHPHADFVSSHLEIAKTTNATLYVSKLVDAAYVHTSFDEGDIINLGTIKLKALNTPGHSPDSICIVLESEENDIAVFTGDTLFIGDCGRPDLRENAGNITAIRETLAVDMYHSLRNKLMTLNNDVAVYPAHGAGTLCGKALSSANMSTIGAERISNWSCADISEPDFVNELIAEQPFIPKYFGFDVSMNRKGADNFAESISNVPRLEPINSEESANKLKSSIIIIDARPGNQFKACHLLNSINLQTGGKFETWLGSIIAPNEAFYLTANTDTELDELIERISKIGYEKQIKGAFISNYCATKDDAFDLEHFKANQQAYTIIDIRNTNEVIGKQIFENVITIPLAELRERSAEIPTDKPIIVHCAGGYRSAAGSSIVKCILLNSKVYDLGESVTTF